MTKYIKKEQLEKLRQQFPAVSYDAEQEKPAIYVQPEDLLAVLQYAKEQISFSFDRLSNLTAVDYKEYFEMVYHLFSRRYYTWLTVKVKLENHEAPEIPSVTGLWEGANFEEREVYDLMGVNFTNHPDMRRILMPDNYGGHPLRKDFEPLVPKIEGGVLTWQKQNHIS